VKALVFEDVTTIRLAEVPDPTPSAPADVVVRVELTAICGSDMHVYHGRERGLDAGTVMGHEFIGTVVDRGREVRALSNGDRVLSPFSTSCGSCFFCEQGLTARCVKGQLYGWVENGEGLHGAQAEYVRVPLAESTLMPIPEDVSPEQALLLGDVLSTGFYCALQAGVRPGGTYVVIGCGPVGLMAVASASELGAERVFAVDSVASRLEFAERLGASPVDLNAVDPAEIVREATDGRGADAALEAVGNASAHRSALQLVRPGGTISVVGVHNEEQFAFTPTELYDRNLTYRVGRCPARRVAEQALPLVRRRGDELAAVLTHRIPLDRGPEAYTLFDTKADGCVKVALSP